MTMLPQERGADLTIGVLAGFTVVLFTLGVTPFENAVVYLLLVITVAIINIPYRFGE